MKRITLLIFLVIFCIQLSGQQHKKVNVKILNIRENAGKKFGIVGQVNQDELVNVLIEKDGWSLIETDGGTKGYVSSEFLISDEIKNMNSDQKSTSWLSILIGIVVFGFVIYKMKDFIFGLFTPKNTPKKSQSTGKSTLSIKNKAYPGYNPQGKPSSSSSNKKRSENESIKEKTINNTVKLNESKSSNSLSSSKQNNTSKSKENYHLSIKDGIVYLGKEKSTMKDSVFNYFDKAVDCDLDDHSNARSRFLVVTAKGEVFLCNLGSTGKKNVFKPFPTYGTAFKAKFSGGESFIFHTEKGSYKGYFNSTAKDKLR